MPERLYSAYQVADLLGVTPAEVAAWIEKGVLTYERLPDGPMRIRQSRLVTFLRNRGADLEEIFAGTVRNDAQVGSEGESKTPPTRSAERDSSGDDEKPSSRHRRRTQRKPIVLPAQEHPLEAGATKEPQEPTASAAGEAPVEPVAEVAYEDREESASGADSPSLGEKALRSAENLLLEAASRRASEVFIDFTERGTSCRLRVDGVVHEARELTERLAGRRPEDVLRRLELLADPTGGCGEALCSGLFGISLGGRKIEIRLSSSPILGGRRIAASLRVESAEGPRLAELGLTPRQEVAIRSALLRPSGLTVVGGYAGSGRWMLLEALARELGADGREVLAVRRTERSAPGGMATLPVHESGPYSFLQAAEAARAQRPDVLVLHDVRTAPELALAEAGALDGMTVLASVTAPSLAAMLEMLPRLGLDSWELAGSLSAAIWQQPLRVLCQHCRRPHPGPREVLEPFVAAPQELENLKAHTAVGCDACWQTGYRGLARLLALLTVDRSLAGLLRTGADARELCNAAAERQAQTPLESGLAMVRSGRTSPEELARVLAATSEPSARPAPPHASS